jgi:hypothetical protein
VRAESARVPSFLRDLLAKTADLAQDADCNGSRPPLYIYMEDYDRSNINNRICWGRASVRRRSHTKKQLRLKTSPRDGRRSLFMELRRFEPT